MDAILSEVPAVPVSDGHAAYMTWIQAQQKQLLSTARASHDAAQRKVGRLAAPSVFEEVQLRGIAMRELEFQRVCAAGHQQQAPTRAWQSGELDDEVGPSEGEVRQLRPPRGSGYAYPARRANGGMSLPARFGKAPSLAEEPQAREVARCARQERIRALEEGIYAHEKDKLLRLGAGTVFFQGPDGETVVPVPPEVRPESRLHMGQRLHLLSMYKSSKERMRDLLLGSDVLGTDAGSTRAPSRAYDASPAPESPTVAQARRLGRREHAVSLALRDTQDILVEVEALMHRGANEDDWRRLAAQLSARAYDVEVSDVLRLVRAVAAAAHAGEVRSKDGRLEMLQAADYMLQSLTARLQRESVDIMTEVLETMCSAGVGTQCFLDMVVTLLLGKHHCDCQALNAESGVRLANALGSFLSPKSLVRLRPQGVGNNHAGVNGKLIDVVQTRLSKRLYELTDEVLASISELFITRLCQERVAKAVVCQMAERRLGRTEENKACLAQMRLLQESLSREMPAAFMLSLPRPVRGYFDDLKSDGLHPSQLSIDDAFAEARARLSVDGTPRPGTAGEDGSDAATKGWRTLRAARARF